MSSPNIKHKNGLKFKVANTSEKPLPHHHPIKQPLASGRTLTTLITFELISANDLQIIKSVHFKNTVTRSSFHLKWMDFNSYLFEEQGTCLHGGYNDG